MGEEVAAAAAVVLEPPRPKSPPRYPDLCGRRRLQLELQILNREIDFLKVRHTSSPALLPFLPVCLVVPLRSTGCHALSSTSPFDLPQLKNLQKNHHQH